jgi:hypothetical protein
LLTETGLGWKSLMETNDLAYNDFLNYGRKTFYNIGPRSQSYKTF